MDRRFVGAVAAVVAVSAGIGIFVGRPEATSPPRQDQFVSPQPVVEDTQTVTVHVSGEVIRPGLVVVAVGARVADAIAAAGGATAAADLSAINLAAPVVDGGHLVMPAVGSLLGPVAQPTGEGPISLNRASASELEALPGVGPVLASRIVAHRDHVGGFDTVEDLLDVAGIGERILAGFRDQVAVP